MNFITYFLFLEERALGKFIWASNFCNFLCPKKTQLIINMSALFRALEIAVKVHAKRTWLHRKPILGVATVHKKGRAT